MGEEENISTFLVFFAALLAMVLVLSKYLHDSPWLSSIFPEAAMVLAVGMAAGFVIHLIMGQRNAMSEVTNDDANANANANDDDDDDADANDDDVYTREDLGALLSFNPEIFFIALLPPIIFNSGLRIGALFFRHFTPIAMFAIVGTTISAITVAFLLKLVLYLGLCGNSFQPTLTELLTFGALISSTDPVSTLAVFQAKKVDPQLFYLVFGESVLNDALAIVLFESFSKFVAKEKNASSVAHGLVDFAIDLFLNSVGSLFLGCLGGICAALIFKQIDMRQSRLVEISLYLLLMYIPFLLAEIMHLSGIVTILFTGIAANRYVVPNLSSITKVNADMLFRLLSHLAETSIFLELGLSVFGLIGHWNWTFIMWSMLACLIARAMHVFPLVFIFNRCLLQDTEVVDDTSLGPEAAHTYVEKITESMDLAEELGPNYNRQIDYNYNRQIDYGIMMEDGNQSFDQSVASEATATPYHRKDLKIRSNTANMMWFSGLRGSVGYACVRHFPDTLGHQKEFTMTTMAIVLITVFLMGGTTETALGFFKINIGVDEDIYMKQSLREPVISNSILKFGTFRCQVVTSPSVTPFTHRCFALLPSIIY
jgi:NhaP-type Na+/H+ or K+/H+ antiporter